MSTNEPQKFKYKSIFEEVGMVGLAVSYIGSEVSLSSFTVFLAKLFGLPERETINSILQVLFTSLPLTIATAIMFVYYKQRSLTLLNATYILGIAVVASFVLNIVLNLGMPSIPFSKKFGIFGIGPSYLFNHLTTYGPFPFIKSCVLGYFFGKWYLRLESLASKQEQKKLNVKNDTEIG